MLRASLKSSIGYALNATAADRLIGSLTGAGRQPLNIGYHRVVQQLPCQRDAETPAMAISSAMFERQLDWIGRRYQFVSLDELGGRLESGNAWTRPTATISFDDGYADVYHHAFPLLQRKGIPAAVFVVTDWIGETKPFTHERIYRLLARCWARGADDLAALLGIRVNAPPMRNPFAAMRFILENRSQREVQQIIAALEQQNGGDDRAPDSLRPLDWAMVATMHRAGVTIGSHTRTHPVLTNEGMTSLVDELTASRETLGQRLKAAIKCFAYPDGAFNSRVVDAVSAAGYRFAFTTCRHRDPHHPLLTIPRRFLWQNSCLDAHGQFSPGIMSCLACGVYDLATSCGRRHSIDARHRLQRSAAPAQEIG